MMAFMHQNAFVRDKTTEKANLGLHSRSTAQRCIRLLSSQEQHLGVVQTVGNHGADRDDFDDAIDFVGWYNHTTNKTMALRKTTPSDCTSYHEGHGGYKRGTYRSKPAS